MSQTRGRWLIKIVLLLAVIAFVGVSMVPLFSTAFKESQPSSTAVPAVGQSPVGQQSKLAQSVQGYELVLRREPENQTALRGLVDARIQTGDIKGAVAPMEKLAALNPKDTQYSLLLAQAKQQLGDQEGAAAAYRSILKTEPGNINALQGLASFLLQQNQPQAAISLLQDTLAQATQANQTQPGSVDVASVQLTLGQVYAIQKNYESAIAIYDQLIKTNKQDFRPILAKAIALKQQGKTAEAKPLFESATALAPAQAKTEINKIATEQPAPTAAPSSPTAPVPASPTPTPSSTTDSPTPAPSSTTDKQ